MSHYTLRLIALCSALAVPGCDRTEPAAAAKLDKFYDQIDVTHHWLAGKHVDWMSGDPDGEPVPVKGYHTHCSAFVAAACERLGVYILRPPDHPQTLLADAQADWLASEAGRVQNPSRCLGERGDTLLLPSGRRN